MSAAADHGRHGSGRPSLYERRDHLSRTDLWAWEDAVRRVEGAAEPPPRSPITFAHVVDAMREPSFYDDPPSSVEVRETHISWVFLAGDRAYKLKKPIVFPFLDYGTAERRREMCVREVELNRRLAGDVYVGVRAIVFRGGRLRLAEPGPGAIEHVVEMRRFDDAETLAAAVIGGRVEDAQVAQLGRRLAGFHAAAAPRPCAEDALVAVKRVADGNFEALLASRGPLDERRVLAAQRFADAFLAGQAATLQARAASGLVREGHGDLRAEHILLGEDVRIVDCAEFDSHLREIDVGADLAFLVMDLVRLGRPDLARVLVESYRAAGGHPGGDAWIAFHAALRAWVRAKVAVLRSLEHGAPAERPAEALELFALGERLAWQARQPLALIVSGAPATGKTLLARALADRSGLPVVGSDETRKRLAGVEPTQPAPPESYGPQAGQRTYAELGRCAAEQVDRARGVIVDATFGRADDRRAFGTAFAERAPSLVFECRAPAAIVQARALARESEPDRISDAGPEVAARLRERRDPIEDDVMAPSHFAVRTDQPVEEVVEDVIAMLDRRLVGSAEPTAAVVSA